MLYVQSFIYLYKRKPPPALLPRLSKILSSRGYKNREMRGPFKFIFFRVSTSVLYISLFREIYFSFFFFSLFFPRVYYTEEKKLKYLLAEKREC